MPRDHTPSGELTPLWCEQASKEKVAALMQAADAQGGASRSNPDGSLKSPGQRGWGMRVRLLTSASPCRPILQKRTGLQQEACSHPATGPHPCSRKQLGMSVRKCS